MKKLYRQLALGLSLSMIVSFGGGVPAQSAEKKPDPCAKYKEGSQAAESIRLYYLRSAETIKSILTNIAQKNDCIKDTVMEVQGENVIVLYGKEDQRKALKRIITILDLPRESVNLEMWGILISSGNPGELAEVMRRVNKEINTTQQLLQYTYRSLEEYAREIDIHDDGRNEFEDLLEQTLGYRGAISNRRPSLSMIDILLRIVAAKDPIENYYATAENLCSLFKDKQYEPYVKALKKEKKIPFENFLKTDLRLTKEQILSLNQDCEVNEDKSGDPKRLLANLNRRRAVLHFALQYSDLVNNPADFDSQSLQQSAETLNSVLQPIVDAINRDVRELFIEPTLARIQNIVSEYDDVEYAEIGKTSVQGLNGVKSTVSSTTVSAFDETGPLRLDELLKDAGELNKFSKDLIPIPSTPAAEASPIPVSSLVSTLAALSKDRSLWRGITSGVSMEITPSVLRNSASAELNIDFTTGPNKTQEPVPDDFTGTTKLRPLSRIAQNTVSTSVYVNTLDIFPISTFNSQTTEDGGRTYLPVIGTIWQGVFSGIPIFGQLFSWKNSPQSVQHQSIVLTNSFIVPTAMGMAHLYQSSSQQGRTSFYDRCVAVENYMAIREDEIKRETGQKQPSGEQNQNYDFNQPLPFSSLELNKKIQDVCGNPPVR